MNINFTEQDKKVAEDYRSGKYAQYGMDLPFISKNQEKCSLELKINDPYKCAVFLADLFYRLRDYTKEECGFEVGAVSLIGVHSDLCNLSDDLREALDKALKNHNLS